MARPDRVGVVVEDPAGASPPTVLAERPGKAGKSPGRDGLRIPAVAGQRPGAGAMSQPCPGWPSGVAVITLSIPSMPPSAWQARTAHKLPTGMAGSGAGQQGSTATMVPVTGRHW